MVSNEDSLVRDLATYEIVNVLISRIQSKNGLDLMPPDKIKTLTKLLNTVHPNVLVATSYFTE